MADAGGFEWDAEKAKANLAKHGVSFEEARTVFYDPLAVTQPDEAHSEEEDRYVILGRSLRGRLLVVAYIQRASAWRISSARHPTRWEREAYEEDIG